MEQELTYLVALVVFMVVALLLISRDWKFLTRGPRPKDATSSAKKE